MHWDDNVMTDRQPSAPARPAPLEETRKGPPLWMQGIDPSRRGYAKAWRMLVDTPIFQDAHLFQLVMYCLLTANHREGWEATLVGRGSTPVMLQPGQLIWGRNAAGRILRAPAKSCEDRLRKLERLGFLAIQPATHYSIVTICNWDVYQAIEHDDRPPTRQSSAHHPPGNRPPSATEQEQENKRTRHTQVAERFPEWWEAYPVKTKRKEAEAIWKRRKLDAVADQLIADTRLKAMQDDEWLRGYAPHPTTYLNGDRWTDEPLLPKLETPPHQLNRNERVNPRMDVEL